MKVFGFSIDFTYDTRESFVFMLSPGVIFERYGDYWGLSLMWLNIELRIFVEEECD